jgi:hypothetical protein
MAILVASLLPKCGDGLRKPEAAQPPGTDTAPRVARPGPHLRPIERGRGRVKFLGKARKAAARLASNFRFCT